MSSQCVSVWGALPRGIEKTNTLLELFVDVVTLTYCTLFSFLIFLPNGSNGSGLPVL